MPGVEASTGSLGHGLPMAVGVAYALRARGRDEQRVFVLTGDAELNEGSNWEAILHAGSARLSNLTLIVDRQPLEHRSTSATSLPSSRAFGWDAVTVDGRDRDALRAAYERRGATGRPRWWRWSSDDHARAGDGDRRRRSSSATSASRS